jgi:hypothetical protein
MPTIMGKTRVSSNENDVDDNDENGEDGELKAFNETSAIY